MLDLPLFIAFLAAATALTLTPGLDTAMVLRAALSSHARAATGAAAGILLGCLTWGGAVSLGLGVLLRASEFSYFAVKIAGAGYLVWLGLGLLIKDRRNVSENVRQPSLDVRTAFRQGLLTNLLNPKVGIFYVSFFPQFIPSDTSVALYSFFLASVHAALSLIWFVILIVAASGISQWIHNPRVISRLDRATGCIFIGFGLKLAFSRS